MSALPSKREFLSLNTNPATNKPFAVFPGRGRFSAEAEAFAAANSTKWAEAAPAVKVPRVKAEKPAESGVVRAARARAAKPETVTEAQGERAKAPSPLDMPRRKQTVAYVTDPSIGKGGTLLAITSCARADKGGCGKAVNRCTHDAPLAPHYLPESVALKPMSLTKPASLVSA